MNKLNSNKGNEIKLDILPWDIFKSDATSYFILKYESISITFKIDISQFMAKMNPNNENENKSDILP